MSNKYATEVAETAEEKARRNAAISDAIGDGEANVTAQAKVVNGETVAVVLKPIAVAPAPKKPGEAGYESKYARKRAWLAANGKWGWEVAEPKPWK